jgi:Domain of unknown function (DUF4331)
MRLLRAFVAVTVGTIVALPGLAQASSHREAPFVTKSPKVDGTDFYMFSSYDPAEAGNVVLIANYLPLQDPFGGPNYFALDPDALYEINVDNTGSCTSKIAFRFQFKNTLASGGAGLALNIGPADAGVSVPVPLINIGAVGSSTLNVSETYTVNMVVGGMSMPITMHGSTSTTFTKPTDNIGVKSFPGGYAAYASKYVYDIDIPGCTGKTGKMFVGQRAESFAVNLGPTFDLIDAPGAIVTGQAATGCPVTGATTFNCVPNPLAGKNITSIELDIPAACLTAGGGTVIGGWTSAYLHQGRVLNPAATYSVPAAEGGPWVEVSRLSNPLVNEVVIGLPDKDKWNGSAPANDVANFANYVEYPTLPELISILFGGGTEIAPQVFPRTDLVAAFLTGLAGVNQFPKTDAGAPGTCEMLRLNTALPVTPAGTKYDCSVNSGTGGSTGQCYLGAALCALNGTVNAAAMGCDLGGFPNGRRPGDDVVDIALDVMMGFLLPATAANPLYNGKVTPLTDGVWQNAGQFDPTFPFLKTPNQGANGNGT